MINLCINNIKTTLIMMKIGKPPNFFYTDNRGHDHIPYKTRKRVLKIPTSRLNYLILSVMANSKLFILIGDNYLYSDCFLRYTEKNFSLAPV